MRNLIKAGLLAVLLSVSICAAAVAGPLEDGQAAYDRADYATALLLWRPLADQGDAGAQGAVGRMYDLGKGVPQDYAQAVKWYRKAADQGDARGAVWPAAMYDLGKGVAQDYAEAVKWYRKAADQGNATAQVNLGGLRMNLGEGVPQDYAEAARWYRKAALTRVMPGGSLAPRGAVCDLGKGVAQDYAEAVKWHRKAADQGKRNCAG